MPTDTPVLDFYFPELWECGNLQQPTWKTNMEVLNKCFCTDKWITPSLLLSGSSDIDCLQTSGMREGTITYEWGERKSQASWALSVSTALRTLHAPAMPQLTDVKTDILVTPPRSLRNMLKGPALVCFMLL
jgi:hypothetical protein